MLGTQSFNIAHYQRSSKLIRSMSCSQLPAGKKVGDTGLSICVRTFWAPLNFWPGSASISTVFLRRAQPEGFAKTGTLMPSVRLCPAISVSILSSWGQRCSWCHIPVVYPRLICGYTDASWGYSTNGYARSRSVHFHKVPSLTKFCIHKKGWSKPKSGQFGLQGTF